MATERRGRLVEIFGTRKKFTSENKAEQEGLKAEPRLYEEKPICKEEEVKKLFVEYKIYNKKRYRANVPQLLEFLKKDENAVTFWENQHIRKLYDISNVVSFFSSIYTEETKDSDYEQQWLRSGLCNPFNNNYVINYECIARIREARLYSMPAILNEIISFCEGTCYVTESKLLENHAPDFPCLYVDTMYMAKRKYGDLLDKNETVSRLPRSNDEETVYILNPLFITENHFLRLEAYDVWRKSELSAVKYEWNLIEKKALPMIQVLDELARSRRVYLNEVKKKKEYVTDVLNIYAFIFTNPDESTSGFFFLFAFLFKEHVLQ